MRSCDTEDEEAEDFSILTLKILNLFWSIKEAEESPTVCFQRAGLSLTQTFSHSIPPELMVGDMLWHRININLLRVGKGCTSPWQIGVGFLVTRRSRCYHLPTVMSAP